jgi:hypothetical protein
MHALEVRNIMYFLYTAIILIWVIFHLLYNFAIEDYNFFSGPWPL